MGLLSLIYMTLFQVGLRHWEGLLVPDFSFAVNIMGDQIGRIGNGVRVSVHLHLFSGDVDLWAFHGLR